MGAAAGHIKHLYEDNDLFVEDIVQIMRMFGSKSIDSKVEEKIDGMNVFISIIDGKIAFARNKTHLKGYGEDSLKSTEQIDSFFNKFENVRKSIWIAYNDLQIILSNKEICKMFDNGHRWINVDIYDEGIKNILSYPYPFVSVHTFVEIDSDGDIIAVYNNNELINTIVDYYNKHTSDRTYYQMVGKCNVHIDIIKVREKIEEYIQKVQSLRIAFDESLGSAKVRWWKYFLHDKFDISDSLTSVLANRFTYSDKTVNLREIKKGIDEGNTDLLLYIQKGYRDDEDFVYRKLKEIIVEFENFILENTAGYINCDELRLNDKLLLSRIKTSLYDTINSVKLYGTPERERQIRVNKHYIYHIGLSKFKALEGIVFYYKPFSTIEKRCYKFTGLFGNLNQITNKLRQ